MTSVTVQASRTYEVKIGRGLLAQTGETLRSLGAGHKVMLVSDTNVYPLYGAAVEASLAAAGFAVIPFVFPAGEASKTLSTYGALLDALCEKGFSRSDTVAALGGGVVGDLAGFAAATFQRGMGLIQLPTSLLAAVDSSVGGKTAVDLTAGKNQVGAFYQPQAVLCDVDTLATLPEAEYRNGCAEIIKYAMIADAALFDRLEGAPVSDDFESVIGRCVAIKRDFVEADEKDKGLRMMLNFGHSFGHAIETLSGYATPHGQAVAMGMAAITRAAAKRGDCDEGVVARLEALLASTGLPSTLPYPAADMARVMLTDKKNAGDALNLILPRAIGKCEIRAVAHTALGDWLTAGGAL